MAAALDQLRPFWPWAAEAGRPFVVIAVCALFAGNAMLGAKASARSVEMAMAIKLAPLLLFIVLAALLPPAATAAPAAAPTLAAAAPLLILGIYLFAGLESAVVMNGEVRDPARTIPRGLFLALALFALLAIAIQIVAARALGPALAGSSAPLVEAAARVRGFRPSSRRGRSCRWLRA